MSALQCKKCGASKYVKNGLSRGKQRYQCKECSCTFTDTPPQGKCPRLKEVAVILYVYCGISMLKIGKMCGVSNVAVLYWIRDAAKDAKELNPKSDSSIVMLDEMWHFVNGKKNKIWLWRAVDGQTRRPLAWLLGNRDSATVKQLIDKVDDGKCIFITDEYQPFFRHIPQDRHYYGKDITYPVEQSNSDIRHWLARFIRRSKSTTRSIAMLASSIALMHSVQIETAFEKILSTLT